MKKNNRQKVIMETDDSQGKGDEQEEAKLEYAVSQDVYDDSQDH